MLDDERETNMAAGKKTKAKAAAQPVHASTDATRAAARARALKLAGGDPLLLVTAPDGSVMVANSREAAARQRSGAAR